MWNYIKKAAAGSAGASIAVNLVQLFRYPVMLANVSGIVDLLFNIVLTFVITTIIVAICIWLWERIFKNNRKKVK